MSYSRAVALALASWLVTGTGQQPAPVHTKVLVRSIGLPAMDRGLRSEIPVHGDVAAAGRRSLGTAAVVPGMLLVKSRSGRSMDLSALRRVGVRARAVETPDHADYAVVRLEAGADPEAAAALLQTTDDIAFAQANYRVYPRFVPNDPLFNLQWGLPAINLERGWDLNKGGTADITVAVLDTGLAFEDASFRFDAGPFSKDGVDYPALGSIDVPFAAAPDIVTAARIVSPHDFIWDDDDPVDLDGHGTHVSGTLGELTDNKEGAAGVAFNVKLMPVKVISTDWDDIFGSPDVGTDDVVARGIRYAADNGAKVINMSIGRTGPPAPAVESAIQYAVGKGVFIAVAGGNDFEEGNPVEVFAEIASRVDGAVAVGAIGPDMSRAFYSNTGSAVELVAPGGDFNQGGGPGGILQQTLDLDLALTFSGPPDQYRAPRFDSFAYFYFEGTSQATPHVSGLAALLAQQGITSPAAIEAALKRFAKDLGAPGRDDEFGNGLIDARTTLRGLGIAR